MKKEHSLIKKELSDRREKIVESRNEPKKNEVKEV